MPNCDYTSCANTASKCDCGAVYCSEHIGEHRAMAGCVPKRRRSKAEAPASPGKASPPEDGDETSASSASLAE